MEQPRDYKVALVVIAEQDGDYRNAEMKKILSTGFVGVDDAIEKFNDIIQKKLGLNEKLELNRNFGRSNH